MTSVLGPYPPLDPSPEEFEKYVKEILDAMRVGLDEYRSTHREKVAGSDGDYEFDITVRFSALGVKYLTLIECKRHATPIKREAVQTLWAKMQSVGAQKGIVFATSGFQSGAIEFANAHGVALVTIADGRSSYLTRAAPSGSGLIPWDNVPEYISKVVGWLHEGNVVSLVSERDAQVLAKTIGFLTPPEQQK